MKKINLKFVGYGFIADMLALTKVNNPYPAYVNNTGRYVLNTAPFLISGDDMMMILPNNVPQQGVSDSGGWNYYVFKVSGSHITFDRMSIKNHPFQVLPGTTTPVTINADILDGDTALANYISQLYG